MKQILLLLLGGMLLSSCVDSNYNLSDIESDDIVIGDDESVFRAPLATIHVGIDELASESVGIEEVCAEADIWLPTELADGYADMERMYSDDAYIDALLHDLTDEMLVSEAKLEAVATLIYDKYRDQVVIPAMPDDVAVDEYVTLFGEALRDELVCESICAAVHDLARGYLSTMSFDDIEYYVDHIDLDEDVVDMIVGNLDPDARPGEKNSLCLYGTVVSHLPFSVNLDATLAPTAVNFNFDVEGLGCEDEIPETQLHEADLRQIVAGITVKIPMTMKRYYPRVGFNDGDEQLALRLNLVKWGGLTLDNL